MSTSKAKPFYPLFIHHHSETWVNPNIEKYLIWDTDNSMSNGSNWSYENVHRVFFKHEPKDFFMIVFYTENDLDDENQDDTGEISKSFWRMIRKYSVIWGEKIYDIDWISPDVGIEKDVNEKGQVSYSWSS